MFGVALYFCFQGHDEILLLLSTAGVSLSPEFVLGETNTFSIVDDRGLLY